MSNIRSVKIQRMESDLEAFGCFASFVFFVFTHPFKKIAIICWIILGINGFSLQDYVRSDRAKVESAKPITETGFSFVPRAFAQGTKNIILIDKKLYGYFDPDVEVWKLFDKPTILIHNKVTGAIFTVSVDALRKEEMLKFVK